MAHTAIFQASGLHCSSCSMLITMSVEDLDGVESVECNHTNGLTTVTYDTGKTSADVIQATIVGAGYDAVLVN